MTDEGPPPPKRVCMSQDELQNLSKDDLLQRWKQQEEYIASLLASQSTGVGENEEQLRKQQQEAARRENVLVMRLTTKEQELQDCVGQLEELKRVQNPSTAHLKDILLDPAINLMFQRMKKEMDQCKDKLEQAQNDLAAWKFTPDGQTGKRLMAKCRMLLQENEELGKNISSGRTAKLEGEVALEKKFVEEMKASQAETDEFLVEMDEDVEGMQSTIYLLQQQLKEAKEQIVQLQTENAQLKNLRDMTHPMQGGDDEQMDTSYERDIPPPEGQLRQGSTNYHHAGVMDSTYGGGVGDVNNVAVQPQVINIQPLSQSDASNVSAVTDGQTDNCFHAAETTQQEQQSQRTFAGNGIHTSQSNNPATDSTQPESENAQERTGVRQETTNTQDAKMDSSDMGVVKAARDNGFDTNNASPTNSHPRNCTPPVQSDKNRQQTEAFEEDNCEQQPSRSATPTMDDSGDQRTVTKTVEGQVVTRSENNELVHNGLIGTQYDSSQDEM